MSAKFSRGVRSESCAVADATHGLLGCTNVLGENRQREKFNTKGRFTDLTAGYNSHI
jgi:hypothetical protein